MSPSEGMRFPTQISVTGGKGVVDVREDGGSGLAHFNFTHHNLTYFPPALAGRIPTGGERPSLHLGLIIKQEILASPDYIITQGGWIEERLMSLDLWGPGLK